MFRPFRLLSTFLFVASPAVAEPPRVVTDIAPIHGLVAQVMQGVDAPDLLLPPGVSPHGYSLRPSQARAMQEADLVVWVGSELTPWLGEAVETLSQDSETIVLLDVKDTNLHPFREAMEDHHEEQSEADDEHEHEEHEHDEHDHDGTDPHAWLDPANATIWLTQIAETLSRLDPEHAQTYRSNAERAGAELNRLSQEIDSQLARMKTRKFVAFHDAYQYFEHRFGLHLAAAIALGDGQKPSPARLAEVRHLLEDPAVACAFSEPQFNTKLIRAAAGDASLRILDLDPLGARLEPGPQLYPQLLKDMATQFAACAEG